MLGEISECDSTRAKMLCPTRGNRSASNPSTKASEIETARRWMVRRTVASRNPLMNEEL